MIWVQFFICASIIILASNQLSKYADVLAEKTGMGRVWVGAILIAGVTSLPELTSGISAIAWLKAPSLAAGAILGSNLFNLGLIAIMDLAYQPGSILTQVQDGHILSGGFGALLACLVATAICLNQFGISASLFGLSLLSVLIFLVYGFGMVMIARFEQRRAAEVLAKEAVDGNYAHISKSKAFTMFSISGVVVIFAGIWLSYIGDQISTTTGLSQTFVGSLFLAASTSLPEVASSLAAIRLGAIDMAIGNVLGSNVLNITLLAVYDLVDGQADFWKNLSMSNALTVVIILMMTVIVIISVTYRASPKTPNRISWDGISLGVLYAVGMGLLYWLG